MSTSILSSGKKNVLKFFFTGDDDESLPSTVLPQDDKNSQEWGYGYCPSPPICTFIKTNEQTFVENQEEFKYNEFVTERTETEKIDRLFRIIETDPDYVNLTAFGNFSTIVKSFLEKDNVKSDFLKYFFSRPELLTRMMDHMVHSTGYQTLSSILHLKKYYSDSNAVSSQFLIHRRRAYSQVFAAMVSPTASVDLVEASVELFVELITDSKSIWDAGHFVERVLLDLDNLKLLLSRLSQREVGQNDQVRYDLLRLLVAMVDFANKKYDEDEVSSFEEKQPSEDEKSPHGDDDDLKIDINVNIVVPEVPNAADEQKNNFIDTIAAKLGDILAAVETDLEVRCNHLGA